MSDERTPQEIEAARQKLLASARAESPDPSKKAAGLDALLSGDVPPLDLEPPPLEKSSPRRWPWLAVGVALLIALWWWLTRQPEVLETPAYLEPVLDAGTPVVPEPLVIVDAGVEEPPPPEIDAGLTVRPKPSIPVEEVDTLAAELALLDEARTLLKSDAAQSLAALNRYSKKFPNGALKLEADVVRVEALFKAGRRHEGLALVEKLRKRDSGGLLEERLRRLIPDAGSPSP